MPDSDPSPEKLKHEARDWAKRLTSGTATNADVNAFKHWRATSQAHRDAFADVKLLWQHVGSAAEESVRRMPLQIGSRSRQGRPIQRRAFLGTACLAAAAAAVVMAERPPLGLWPSLVELNAQYRTSKGQQRQIVLSSASVELNTQTSMNLQPTVNGVEQIELISGEAAITTASTISQPFIVIAGNGKTTADRANFSVRYTNATGYVTCVAGQVRVDHGGAAVMLQPAQQIIYDSNGFRPVTTVDPAVVLAWQQGLLIFRNMPLAKVIREINRYRPGRIVLMDEQLGREAVYGNFRIDRIEEVVPEIQATLGFHVANLPNGVVLIS